MNPQVITAMQKIMRLAGVEPIDISFPSSARRSGVYLKSFLDPINASLKMVGTTKSIEALRALLVAYPRPDVPRSIDYSRKAIEDDIRRKLRSYAKENLPFDYLIYEGEPFALDIVGALESMIADGLKINGLIIQNADSGQNLDLLMSFNVSGFKLDTPTDMPISNKKLPKPNELPNKTKQPAEINQEEIKYQLSYDTSSRELRLNGKLLAKPNYGSENDQFLRYFVTENHTGEHSIVELLKAMGKPKLTKRPTQILGDINIVGTAKRNFFPNASVNGIEFRNPITHSFAKAHGLPEIDIQAITKTVRNSQK